MLDWWEGLSQVQQVLYCIAIPSTLVLVIQMLLTIIGGSSDGGIDVSDTSGLDMPGELDTDAVFDGGFDADTSDVDIGHDGGNPADFGTLRLFTLQTIITFLTVFSWVAIVCVSSKLSTLVSMLIGTACGLVMMFVVAKIIQLSSKLAENGTLNLKNAIGETASVYLTIPACGDGEGKITMELQGRFCEFDAITEESEAITTGAQVLVTDVRGDALVVERCNGNPKT